MGTQNEGGTMLIGIWDDYYPKKFKSLKELVEFANSNEFFVNDEDNNQAELTKSRAKKELDRYALYLYQKDSTDWTLKVVRM